MSPAALVAVLAALAYAAARAQPPPVQPQRFAVEFNDFSSASLAANPALQLNGDARSAPPVLALYPAGINNVGSAYVKTPFVLTNATFFSAFLRADFRNCTNNGATCADGFALSLQADDPTWLGTGGYGLGVLPYGSSSDFSLTIVAVRTYGDVVGLNNADYLTQSAVSARVVLGGDPTVARLWVSYNGTSNTMRAYYSETSDVRPSTPAWSYSGAFTAEHLQNTRRATYVGLSGGCGQFVQSTDVFAWQFATCVASEFVDDRCAPACVIQLPSEPCRKCAPGRFGPSCLPCTACMGTCFEGVAGNCTCPPGAYGETCQPCASCAGTCYPGSNGNCTCTTANRAPPSCTDCIQGYFGPACSPCSECSGVCFEGIAGNCTCPANRATPPSCLDCAPAHYGPLCAPCAACNGTCTDGVRGDCACAPNRSVPPACANCARDYYGRDCLPCDVCREHGACVEGAAGRCDCDLGWAGAACDSCATGWTGPACAECAPGYYGSTCASCAVCNVHGTCNEGIGGSCACDLGWAGDSCTVCAARFTGVACDQCLPEHFGSACAPCTRCVNGTCIAGRNGECECDPGYAGEFCEGELCALSANAWRAQVYVGTNGTVLAEDLLSFSGTDGSTFAQNLTAYPFQTCTQNWVAWTGVYSKPDAGTVVSEYIRCTPGGPGCVTCGPTRIDTAVLRYAADCSSMKLTDKATGESVTYFVA